MPSQTLACVSFVARSVFYVTLGSSYRQIQCSTGDGQRRLCWLWLLISALTRTHTVYVNIHLAVVCRLLLQDVITYVLHTWNSTSWLLSAVGVTILWNFCSVKISWFQCRSYYTFSYLLHYSLQCFVVLKQQSCPFMSSLCWGGLKHLLLSHFLSLSSFQHFLHWNSTHKAHLCHSSVLHTSSNMVLHLSV